MTNRISQQTNRKCPLCGTSISAPTPDVASGSSTNTNIAVTGVTDIDGTEQAVLISPVAGLSFREYCRQLDDPEQE